ncbi:quinon protein alcohol dehydrogenase-like superfamily [Mycena olivaceomarginata]|nr:quinon protein alcohol dehydrogenase-like superfamily [Mycena olivaceomarginata]
MSMITAADFFSTWQHALSYNFQWGDLLPTSDPRWVSELKRIEIIGDGGGAVAVSPNVAWVATVAGGDIHVYDVVSSELVHSLQGHAGHVRDLEFHPGGRKLASGSSPIGYSRESLIRAWDLNDDDTHSTCCDDAASAAVTSASSILLKHWSEEDVKAANLQIDFAEIIFKAQIAVDVRNGLAFVGQLPHFQSRAFSHDGSSLLYLPDPTIVAVLDVHTLAERLRLVGHADEIMWAETSPNDKVVATSSWDRTVRIWSMKSGEILHILEGSAGQSWSGAFSPDGELVAAGSGDKMVRIWRVDTGELLYTFSGFQGWVRTLAFSPDGLHQAR